VRDSFDEEWEFRDRSPNQPVPLDSNVNTRDMVDNAFLEEPLPPDVEDVVHDVVAPAFDLANSVHEECSDSARDDERASLSN
jgi:hypothetical protein